VFIVYVVGMTLFPWCVRDLTLSAQIFFFPGDDLSNTVNK